MTQITKLTSWPRMTLTWPRATTESSKWCIWVLDTLIMSIHGLLNAFVIDKKRSFRKPLKFSTFCLWPGLWRHRWPGGKISHSSLKVHLLTSHIPFEVCKSVGNFPRCQRVVKLTPLRVEGSEHTPTGRGLNKNRWLQKLPYLFEICFRPQKPKFFHLWIRLFT